MPPTIQTGVNADRDKVPVRPGERRSELVCRVKYCNTLPDIPFDPKFIQYPFSSTRFIEYNPTSLERNYKYEVLTEHDLGVTIDLINKDTYACELGATLDPADEKLLEEDAPTLQDSKRSRHHAKAVSWLRRTEYISTEQTRFQPQSMDKVEAKVGFSIKKEMKEETLAMDRDAQILAIDKTFEDVKKPIEKHYSKPNVVPVEILPVFPDFKVWKYPCAQVMFDSDPAPIGRSVPAQIEMMSQAMIRGVKDETGEQFVAYFLPTEETLEKRKADFIAEREYLDDEEYEYKMAREYNWNVKSKTSGKGYEENYFLVVRQDGIYYNELETRVRLSKRRQKAGTAPNNTRLVVRHCPLSAQEFKMQRYRERQLEAPNEEEEEEDEEEEEEQAGSGQEGEGEKSEEEGGNKSDTSRASRRSRSGSGSDSDAKSGRSRSSSGSGSRSQSRSKSGSRSRSRSRSRSKSGSRSRSASGSPARSGSGTPKSRSRSPARSGSGSPAKSRHSGSRSPARSGSGSPAHSARSGSGSPARSGSGSPARSKRSASGSPARSGSGSPAQSVRSGSASPAKSSGSGSDSGSGSASGSDSD